jgi:hypothetical protein
LVSRGSTYDEAPVPIGWTHPVETVSWEDCALRLPRVGLSLPTEAQWEYGARGGTETPWWTGKDASTLSGAGNVLDQRAQRAIPQWGLQEGDFDDGYVAISPGGAFRANAFGLFDVHGNVWEWCADVYSNRYLAPRAGDGLRSPVVTGPADRVYRGGSCSNAASMRAVRVPPQRHPVVPRQQLGCPPRQGSRLGPFTPSPLPERRAHQAHNQPRAVRSRRAGPIVRSPGLLPSRPYRRSLPCAPPLGGPSDATISA